MMELSSEAVEGRSVNLATVLWSTQTCRALLLSAYHSRVSKDTVLRGLITHLSQQQLVHQDIRSSRAQLQDSK